MSTFPRVWNPPDRREYGKGSLSRSDLVSDPFLQFQSWFEEGKATVDEPNAIALATAEGSGRPSIRMVLLKGYDERGFVFATSYLSRKSAEIADNPQAAILLYWPELERQVRAVGAIERATLTESDAIFANRPRLSRLAAVVSVQSARIEHRSELEAAMREADDRFEGREIERPPHWGAYRLIPSEFEFWQGRKNRLHDRFQYLREESGWTIHRLQP